MRHATTVWRLNVLRMLKGHSVECLWGEEINSWERKVEACYKGHVHYAGDAVDLVDRARKP